MEDKYAVVIRDADGTILATATLVVDTSVEDALGRVIDVLNAPHTVAEVDFFAVPLPEIQIESRTN